MGRVHAENPKGWSRSSLEAEDTVAAYGAEVAGQVDPLLAVPVGEQGVDGHHVLVEELAGGGAGGDRGESQHAGPDRASPGRGGRRPGGPRSRPSAHVDERLLGVAVEELHVGPELVGGPGQRLGDAGAELVLEHAAARGGVRAPG